MKCQGADLELSPLSRGGNTPPLMFMRACLGLTRHVWIYGRIHFLSEDYIYLHGRVAIARTANN